ncbi:purine permease, putative [Talaromyces stipitatus ATCC 10500]|uniref:Purine permease, putative n=1 Tax=Talaromyces stipitatus (strain ATCC 10500 / CBS 375.48 / QM 6759 / NRRL 1006) TaxID=441959 RepID=B8M3X9_TALSN|nr:purine permease, putative [Talaromyces stipitatus ATCC 10500]EED20722.1 purine permease, putative [Talaromyces stipitatus ATCC 10500]
MDGPDQIGPDTGPKRTISDRFRRAVRSFTTKEGLIGDYDYALLFRPNLPFMKKARSRAPFFGLHDRIPILLALLLGLQHALAMLAGVITPPIIIGGVANFDSSTSQYLVSTSLIVSGILSAIQITRFSIPKTPYYLGTGLISVAGTSFSTLTIANNALSQMYASGYCPVDPETGAKLACPHGYGAILGTSCLCALLEIGLSFVSIDILKRVFPPLVTGPTVLLIGVSLIESGLKGWAGGSGNCSMDPSSRALCPSATAPHALPWGSAEFIGLGFLVFLTIILCERFGSPIMKSCSVVLGLLVGCIVAAACGYFDRSSIDAAPVASFIWVKTFPLKIYAPLILPFLALYIVLMMETIGDVTATCDVSRLDVEGELFDSRIRGGVLADGFAGLLAGLCTITPMSTFAQNNGVIALTRCASRRAGYFCCFFLIVMGIFSKFAAALVAIPSPVLGGMTTFLFSSVAISGIRIIATMPFTRRNRFILTAAFAVGMGATLVPDWFSYVFTYHGNNKGLTGLIDAIELIMTTGFVVAGLLALVLNLLLPEEDDEEDTDTRLLDSDTTVEENKTAAASANPTLSSSDNGEGKSAKLS